MDEGIIGEGEYIKYLIGDKRRKFIVERQVRAEMQQEMNTVRQEMEARLVDERRLRDDIEKKLEDLRAQSTNVDTSAAISTLESARQELDDSQFDVNAYKEVLTSQAANVVNLFADNDFLEATNMTYIQYYGFEWPKTVSETSFYIFATLLCPKSEWDGQIRSNSSIRHMQAELRDYVQAEQENVGESEADVAELNDIVQTFTSSCDLIRAGEERAAKMTNDGAQQWLDEQKKFWNDAKAAFKSRFKLDSQAPLQHIRLVNDFADTWRAQKAAEERNLSAIALANGLV